MTILDIRTLFSDDQAITATAVSTNVLDRGVVGTPVGGAAALSSDLGKSMVPFEVIVTEAFATLTSLTITLETDDNSGFSSALTKWTSGAVAAAALVVGKRIPIGYVPEGVDERYVRLNYTVTGSSATAGKITAGIAAGLQTNR